MRPRKLLHIPGWGRKCALLRKAGREEAKRGEERGEGGRRGKCRFSYRIAAFSGSRGERKKKFQD